MKHYTLLLVLMIITNACQPKFNNTSNNMKETTLIKYRFTDSSVPPQYHRSFTINLTNDSLTMVVDSYGTLINEIKQSSTKSNFEKALNLLESSKLSLRNEKTDDKGCTGGTTENIELFRNDKSYFDAYVYHCGNSNFGTLEGDLSSTVDFLKSLIPNFQKQLKRGEG